MNVVFECSARRLVFSIAYAAMNTSQNACCMSFSFSIAYAAMNIAVAREVGADVFSIAYAAMNDHT